MLSKFSALGRRLVFAGLFASTSLAAFAQDRPARTTDDEEQKPEESASTPSVEEYVFVEGTLSYLPSSNTIVTKLPLDRRATPNNVGLVTAPLIRDQFDRVLGESLVNVSNVNVQSQNGVHDYFFIRGFDSLSSGLVLTDGAAEPEATFYQMYNVQLVEVLKGPGGFLYGSNPLAGAINLVRKQPASGKFLDFGASAGSFDSYEGAFDWNYGAASSPLSFRVNGLVRDQGSYRDGKEGRTVAINPALAWRIQDDARLNLNFEVVGLDVTPDSGLPVVFGSVPDVDRGTSYQSSLDRSNQDILRFQADYEWQARPWLTIRDKFYRRDLDWLSDATFFSGVAPTGPDSLGIIRTLVKLDDRQAFTGNQLEAVLRFDTGAVGHSLLTGLEIARYADLFDLGVDLLPTVDAASPVEPVGTPPIPLPDQGFAGDSRSLIAAPYLIDQLRLGSRFDVLLGARIDRIDFRDETTATERIDTEVSPMLGGVYRPAGDVSIYGNFSRSFAPPSARVVGERSPERGTQYEAGVKTWLPTLDAQATFAVYQLERDNIPIPDDNGFTQQAGNQRSRGFEVDLSLEPSSTVRAFFSYAFNDAELTNFTETVQLPVRPPTFTTVDRSGNRPAFAPRHLMNLWVGKDLTGSLAVGGGARYVGAQFIAEDNGFVIDGVLTFDAMVSYRVGSGRIRLNLRNITDREYYLRGFGAVSVIPAPPFSAYLGFDYQL